MKKRLAKVLALGLTAAMVAGTPLSAMASEVNAADRRQESGHDGKTLRPDGKPRKDRFRIRPRERQKSA